MRSRHPLIAWAAMALLLLTAAGQAAAAPPAAAAQPSTGTATGNTVADVEKSVIQLAQKWEGYVDFGSGWQGPVEAVLVCSGFFVTSSGHAVTAGHCVEPGLGRRSLIEEFLREKVGDGTLTAEEAADLYPRAVANWEVEGSDGGSPPKLTVYAVQPHTVEGAVLDRATVAQVLDFRGSEQGDVALLKIEANNTPALPVAAEDPANNTAVTSIGFPAAVAEVVDSTQVRADFKSGTVSSHQTSKTGVPMTGVNADLSGGMSGGPTVNDLGNVLGVNSSGIQGEQNFNFITDTSDLRDWLQGKSLQLLPPNAPVAAPTAPTEPDSTGIPSWVWPALAAAGVVLVAGLVVAMVMSRRRRARAVMPVPAEPYQPVQQPEWQPSGSFPWGPPQGPWGAGTTSAPQFGHSTTPAFGASATMRQCASCGSALPANGQFCSSCGRSAY